MLNFGNKYNERLGILSRAPLRSSPSKFIQINFFPTSHYNPLVLVQFFFREEASTKSMRREIFECSSEACLSYEMEARDEVVCQALTIIKCKLKRQIPAQRVMKYVFPAVGLKAQTARDATQPAE